MNPKITLLLNTLSLNKQKSNMLEAKKMHTLRKKHNFKKRE